MNKKLLTTFNFATPHVPIRREIDIDDNRELLSCAHPADEPTFLLLKNLVSKIEELEEKLKEVI